MQVEERKAGNQVFVENDNEIEIIILLLTQYTHNHWKVHSISPSFGFLAFSF